MAPQKDKRRFKRYTLASECFVSFEDKSYKCYTTDYSLKGIGFSFHGSPPIVSGLNVRFRIDELDLDDEGMIAWSRKANGSLIAGIEKKSISGLLKHFPPADILIDLQRSEKNGILIFGNGPVMKKIFIKNGDMVYATSNSEKDQLIEVVRRAGKISGDQYRQLGDVAQKKKESHAALLVEHGYLQPEDIVWSVKKQVEEIILSIFEWGDGRFGFFEGPRLSDKVITLKLSAADLIYRGIKASKNIPAIHTLPPLETVLSYSADPMNLFQELAIDETDKKILSLVDGKRSIKEILSLSPLEHAHTTTILYAFLNARILELGTQPSVENTIYEESIKEASPKIDPGFVEQADSLYRRLDSIDHYSFLGIEKRASQDIIRKAYYTAAKEYHPDRHLHIPTADLKSKLNAIFSHLTEVYKTLSNPKTRQKYDDTLSIKPAPLQQNTAELARTRFEEGESAFRRGAFSEARELFGQALYLDSSVAAYYFQLGRALMHEKNFSEAVKMFNQALIRDPYNADYLSELGHVYLTLGFNLRAKSTFEKAMQFDPHNTRAITGLHMLQSPSGS